MGFTGLPAFFFSSVKPFLAEISTETSHQLMLKPPFREATST